MRHSPLSRSLVILALVPALAGLVLGNATLLLIAATVFLVLVRARDDAQSAGSVRSVLPGKRAQRAATVRARLDAELDHGPYVGLVHQELPESFVLLEGTNVHLVEPGSKGSFAFAFAGPRRGAYDLEAPTLDLVHPLLLAPAVEIARGDEQELTIEPLVRPLRTVKGLRGPAKDRHGEDLAIRGPTSTDFQELRDYVRGDPLKFVNWKATAKRSVDDLSLVVNKFEPEARKNVWFFLDLDESLEVGDTLNTALEDAIDISLAIVHHFASRGHRIGGCTYNGQRHIFYPDSGSRQELKIARTLARVSPGSEREGLPAAVESVKGFLARERPLTFVITRPEVDTERLLTGVRRIHMHAATARRASPITVLAPEPRAGDVTDALARSLSRLEAKRRVSEHGAPLLRIHHLTDGARGLERALARGVLAR